MPLSPPKNKKKRKKKEHHLSGIRERCEPTRGKRARSTWCAESRLRPELLVPIAGWMLPPAPPASFKHCLTEGLPVVPPSANRHVSVRPVPRRCALCRHVGCAEYCCRFLHGPYRRGRLRSCNAGPISACPIRSRAIACATGANRSCFRMQSLQTLVEHGLSPGKLHIGRVRSALARVSVFENHFGTQLHPRSPPSCISGELQSGLFVVPGTETEARSARTSVSQASVTPAAPWEKGH